MAIIPCFSAFIRSGNKGFIPAAGEFVVMAKKRLLVLCVDVDDDLGVKARVRGPVIGRKANLEAATKLALADPEDADANTVFDAVKTAEQLSGEHDVEVATIVGSGRSAYHADVEIAKQLDRVIKEFVPESCVFVSDGASDERVLPLIQSRIRVDSVRTVNVKQSKELEKTYFVILDKLKEPAFARVVFGVPGAALLLYFLFGDPGLRWFVGFLGIYLVLNGFGVEEMLFKKSFTFKVSPDSLDFVFYFASAPLFIASFWLAISRVLALEYAGESNLSRLAAWFLKDLLLLLPIALFLVIGGLTLRAISERKNYQLPTYVVYGSMVLLFWLIFNNAADWILGDAPFSSFFYALLLGVVAMYLASYLAAEFRKSIISRMNIVGKGVYTEMGSFVGKIADVDKRAHAFVIKTQAGQRIDLEFDHISSVGETVVVKY